VVSGVSLVAGGCKGAGLGTYGVLNAMEPEWKYPRIRVRFRSSFFSAEMVAGEGLLKHLSVRGCRISSAIPILVGTELQICLFLTDCEQEAPVTIDRALVQWIDKGEFGVEFLELGDEAPEQIRRFVRRFVLDKSA